MNQRATVLMGNHVAYAPKLGSAEQLVMKRASFKASVIFVAGLETSSRIYIDNDSPQELLNNSIQLEEFGPFYGIKGH